MKKTLLALAACFASTSALAIDFDWTNASGVDSNWNTAGNWTPAGPPSGGGGNFARFYPAATGPAILNTDQIGTVQDILFGNNGTVGIRQLNQTAGTVSPTGWVRMGVDVGGNAGDAGHYNMTGGTLTTGRLNVAELGSSIATFSIGGTASFIQNTNDGSEPNWTRIGDGGQANFNLSDNGLARFFGNRVMIGAGGASSATVTQTGGIFEIQQGKIIIADSSPNAIYNISGGIMRTLAAAPASEGAHLTIGGWDNSHGQVNVSGTGLVNIREDIIMGDGQNNVALPSRGTITQTGGTVMARNLRMGSSQQGTATVNVSAGLFDLNPTTVGGLDGGELVVGENTQTLNNALFSQTGGDVNFRRAFVGRNGSSRGTVTVSNGNFRQDTVNPDEGNNWNHIGENGVANFNVSNTANVSFNARTHLGTGGTGNGTVTQTGGLFEVRDHELIIGDQGIGTFNISAGVLQTARAINVGNWNNGNGNLNVSGSAQVLVGQGMTIGQTENGGFTSTGTVTQTGGLVRIQDNMALANGNASLTTSGTYNLNGGILDMTASIGAPNGDINKGTGVATFNFNNGRLQDLRNYNLGGTLTQADGILAPGAALAVGTTTINANYSLLSDGEIELTITLAPAADVINVNGTVTITGSLLMQDAAGLAQGLTFTFLNNDGVDPVIGTFFGLPEGADFTSPAGNTFDISYVGGDGNDIRVEVVPEPITGVMLLGATGLLVLLRRRRSA